MNSLFWILHTASEEKHPLKSTLMKSQECSVFLNTYFECMKIWKIEHAAWQTVKSNRALDTNTNRISYVQLWWVMIWAGVLALYMWHLLIIKTLNVNMYDKPPADGIRKSSIMYNVSMKSVPFQRTKQPSCWFCERKVDCHRFKNNRIYASCAPENSVYLL